MDAEHTHVAFCSKLENEVNARKEQLSEYLEGQNDGQSFMGSVYGVAEAIMGETEHLLESNCAHTAKPYEFAETDSAAGAGVGDAKRALLQFMIAATPNERVLQDIMTRYDEHLSNMASTFENHLVGDHDVMVEHITNVPDTVNPVKAKLSYVQVPKGDKTVLNLVWKVSNPPIVTFVPLLIILLVRGRDGGQLVRGFRVGQCTAQDHLCRRLGIRLAYAHQQA